MKLRNISALALRRELARREKGADKLQRSSTPRWPSASLASPPNSLTSASMPPRAVGASAGSRLVAQAWSWLAQGQQE